MKNSCLTFSKWVKLQFKFGFEILNKVSLNMITRSWTWGRLIYIILYVYMYRSLKYTCGLKIRIYKFWNKLIKYQIIICNLLII